MSEYDVIGLGVAFVDVVIRLEEMPRWENPGWVSGFTLADGGPAATACVVASTLGARTGVIDYYGNDEIADIKMRSLKRAGVDLSRMVKRDAPEDHVIVVYVDEKNGERYFSPVKGVVSRPVRIEELDRDYITSAKYLHLDCSHRRAALQAARWMHQAGKTVVCDASKTNQPVPGQVRELVSEVDILICGSGFGPNLTGHEDIWQAGRAILDIGPRIVVQTEGINGSYTVSRDEEFHTPAFEIDVVDTTGAGDVFHGGYLFGLLKGWDLKRIATFSSAVSAIHSTVLGNRKGIPSLKEVEAFIQEKK